MNTFEAIANIRRQSLNRSEAMRYLMENLGFSTTYADEIVAVIFTEESEHRPAAMQGVSGR